MKNSRNWLNQITILAVLLILMSGYHSIAGAQYQVYHWASFEDARFPNNYSPIGKTFQKTAGVLDLNNLAGAPSQFRSETASLETGRFSMAIQSNPQSILTGIGTGITLFREKLGNDGRALYQADFFVPDEKAPLVNMAVLAMKPMKPGQKDPSSFYRFGLARLGKNAVPAFYLSHIAEGGGGASMFHMDPGLYKRLPKPGWHRFSIVFEGQNTIRCYVDGIEPKFSPVYDNSLQEMQIGIMIAEKKHVVTTYVDNLSIQWTPENIPIPDSPYASSWPAGTIPTNHQEVVKDLEAYWMHPTYARARAMKENKPIFVYMQSPRVPASLELERLIARTPEARGFLDQFIPVRVDVNQLMGGTIAQSYTVSRIPTVLLINPDGTEITRGVFTKGQTWEELESQLTKKGG